MGRPAFARLGKPRRAMSQAMNRSPVSGFSLQEATAERALRARFACILAAVGLLLVAAGTRWLRPDQPQLAEFWALLSTLSAAAPVGVAVIGAWWQRRASTAAALLDQFIGLAILACLAAGQFFLGSLVAVILVLGQMIEDRSMLGTQRAVEGLIRLGRVTARRLRGDGGEEIVESTDLVVGDLIRLRPGDRVPADGRVLRGTSAVDQAPITGESLPVEAGPDTRIFAGSTNLSGLLEMEVTEIGERTIIGHARTIVEEARQARAPILRLTERFAGYYFPLVLLLCGFVLFFTGELSRAISVLIVSLPCAFLLAAPTALVAALASATRMGLLIKSVRFLEEIPRLDTVIFDKTGTLTSGKLQVTALEPEAGFSADELLAKAAALLGASSHPLAQAICHHARALDRKGGEGRADRKDGDESFSPPAELREVAGMGVQAVIDGQRYLAGRRLWLAEQGVAVPADLAETEASEVGLARLPAADSSAEIAGADQSGQWLGRILLADTVRPHAAEVVRALQEETGVGEILLVSGDRPPVAAAVARDTGIVHYHGGCLPSEKMDLVRSLQEKGRRVMVVGDGINDAPALAAGSVSLALGSLGSQIAIETADIALMSDDLRRVPALFSLSRQTRRVIGQNLLFGAFFLLIALTASILGWVGPLGAALLHEASAFFVLANSARLLRFEPVGNVGKRPLQGRVP